MQLKEFTSPNPIYRFSTSLHICILRITHECKCYPLRLQLRLNKRFECSHLSSMHKENNTSTLNTFTLVVLADFSKAFDTVNYKTLITKLSTLGFLNSFLRWLNSYLSDRSYFVQIDDCTSESVDVQFGVPQGSILGPMLFNLYVSDLQDHLRSSIGSFQYTDDTTIYSSCPAPHLSYKYVRKN